MSRDGPGLLLRDLGREDDQIAAVLGIIDAVRPDVLLMTDFDHDLDGLARAAFAEAAGYPHHFAATQNTGMMTDQDLDQNGALGEPRDAQGYGRFRGDGGMALFARWPMVLAADHSELLWKDAPGATLPEGWPEAVTEVQRLSHGGHWIVTLEAPGGPVPLMAFAASPPVFDGPEDRNGLRNADEIGLWAHVIGGGLGGVGPDFVLLGNANLDPVDGDGRREAIRSLLALPELQDPAPRSAGGVAAADPDHTGDPGLDNADWRDGAPGNLRVSYVLPAATWVVTDAGVFWPAPDDPDAALLGDDGFAAGRHRLTWVEVTR